MGNYKKQLKRRKQLLKDAKRELGDRDPRIVEFEKQLIRHENFVRELEMKGIHAGMKSFNKLPLLEPCLDNSFEKVQFFPFEKDDDKKVKSESVV